MKFGKLNATIFVLLSIFLNSAAFARKGDQHIANRQITNVSECSSATYGALKIQSAHLTLTFRTQRLILENQNINSFASYGRAVMTGGPIEDVFGPIEVETETLRFFSNGQKTAMQLCSEVMVKIINGF